jgi:acetoin utilization deacetylase AcuC-like enzyme
MGFSLLNNIAIGARTAQAHGYEKILILDIDVHHGNGNRDH